MSNIIEVTEMWSKPVSSVTLSDNFRKRQIKLQRAFQILTTPQAKEVDCFSSTGILEGDRFSEDFPYAFADNFSLSRQSLILWQLNIDYTGELGPSENEDNPLFAPPRIDWDDVETEEEIDAYESETGFAIDPEFYNDLGLHTQVCIKGSNICYAHGRVVYSRKSFYL